MKTGVIMEINERFLTLLTPDGEFLQAKKLERHYQIGQEIDFFPVEQEEIEKRSILSIFQGMTAKLVFAATLVFMLVTASVIPFNGNNEVYAYMSIDINPSMELALNEEYQVIDINPYNEEAKQVVEKLSNWKKKDVHIITKQIIEEIEKQGYTEKNHEIVIATVFVEEKTKENDQRWQKEITQIQSNIRHENIEVEVVQGTKEEREKAKEKGITTGALKKKQLEAKPKETKEQNQKARPINPDKQEQQDNEKLYPSSKKDHENGKQIPPGQEKKTSDQAGRQSPSRQEKKTSEQDSKQIPPGQKKKITQENKVIQENSNNQEKKIPPGQMKKQDNRSSVNENKSQQEWNDKKDSKDQHKQPGKEKQKEEKKNN